MKRIVCLLAAILLLCLLPALSLGEGEQSDAAYSWTTLATVAGATAATLLIVQYVKAPLDKVWKIPTRLMVLAIAFLILLGAQAFTVGLGWADVPLLVVNAFVVALASMGAYEATFAKRVDEPPDAG